LDGSPRTLPTEADEAGGTAVKFYELRDNLESPYPTREEGEARLASRFGDSEAEVVLSRLRELEGEFYRSDARLTVADIAEAGEVAAAEFQSAHPEISEEAVRALAWCYTFDFK
jgi:hypothetical protein